MASSMETRSRSQSTVVASASTAEFLGSFAAGSRKDHRQPLDHGSIKERIWIYLTDGWTNVEIWRSAFIECVGSLSVCYLSSVLHITIGSFNTSQVAGYVGVTNIVLLSLFIYALSPGSGGHINPIITFTTITAGLTSLPRGILYMIGQTLGAAVAGGLLRGSFGPDLIEQYQGGGCFIPPSSVLSRPQIFLIEVVLCFILILLSFGVGLDPRQRVLFGPKMGPFLVACALGLVSFASVGLAPGYPGAGLSPGRCFACAVARGEFSDQWIWWFGPLAGGLLHTTVYHIAPPYHREKVQELQEPPSNSVEERNQRGKT